MTLQENNQFDWRTPGAHWLVQNDDLLYRSVESAPLDIVSLRIEGDCSDFHRLSDFTKLQELHVFGLSKKNSGTISNLKSLKRLAIRAGGVQDLDFLQDVKRLDSLQIWQTSRLKSLSGLSSATELKMLILFEATSGSRTLDIAPIETLRNLEYLELRGPMKIESLGPVSKLDRLKSLYLYLDVKDKSLQPLLSLRELATLDMWKLDKIFPTEELAIAASLEPKLIDKWFDYRRNEVGLPCKKCGSSTVVLIGRGTRGFCPSCSPKRGEEFKETFLEMVKNVAT
jgi:hypothetical protein